MEIYIKCWRRNRKERTHKMGPGKFRAGFGERLNGREQQMKAVWEQV